MANLLTATLSLTYGDSAIQGAVLAKRPFTFTLAYGEESTKIVSVPAASTDYPISLDSVTAPKFFFMRAVDIDLEVKLVSGGDEVETSLAVASGYILIANPSGQAINSLLVTTPATPTSGGRIEIIAFE